MRLIFVPFTDVSEKISDEVFRKSKVSVLVEV